MYSFLCLTLRLLSKSTSPLSYVAQKLRMLFFKCWGKTFELHFVTCENSVKFGFRCPQIVCHWAQPHCSLTYSLRLLPCSGGRVSCGGRVSRCGRVLVLAKPKFPAVWPLTGKVSSILL